MFGWHPCDSELGSNPQAQDWFLKIWVSGLVDSEINCANSLVVVSCLFMHTFFNGPLAVHISIFVND